jgi:hypothetical protein
MEKKYKYISILMVLLNIACSLAYLFINTENNVLWTAAFGLNAALLLINIRVKMNVTLFFFLTVYYLYWAIIHWPQNGLLTADGMKTELIVSLLAGWAFISSGYLYMINRNRW